MVGGASLSHIRQTRERHVNIVIEFYDHRSIARIVVVSVKSVILNRSFTACVVLFHPVDAYVQISFNFLVSLDLFSISQYRNKYMTDNKKFSERLKRLGKLVDLRVHDLNTIERTHAGTQLYPAF